MATIFEQHIHTSQAREKMEQERKRKFGRKFQLHMSKQVVLLIFTAVLLFGSIIVSNYQPAAHAANPGTGNGCSWYRIQRGDTLTRIAVRYHTNIWTLAQINYIRNVNLIIVGHALCIPYRLGSGSGSGRISSGVLPNGTVRWYAYNALEWSTRPQVVSLLHRAASIYHLPANLLIAIAWQESGGISM
jgi:hypothetical protein